jgi:hypothetical protein
MNSIQKLFAGLGLGIVIALITLLYARHTVSKNEEFRTRELQDLKNILARGELIYQHQRLIAAQNQVIDADKKGEFSESKVSELMLKHQLKSKSASNKDTSSQNKKKTYLEKQYKYSFEDQALKSIILFLLDVEALGNVTVRDLRINRNPKNSDLWSSTFTIVNRLKKDEPKS